MDFNYIIALIMLATKKLNAEEFGIAYNLLELSIENTNTSIKPKNQEIISIILRVYDTELSAHVNLIDYINYIDGISIFFSGANREYYKYQLLAGTVDYPLVDKLNLIKNIDENVEDIETKKEILFLKLNVANHELNYNEMEVLIAKIKALTTVV